MASDASERICSRRFAAAMLTRKMGLRLAALDRMTDA